jgi:hypothetical protein
LKFSQNRMKQGATLRVLSMIYRAAAALLVVLAVLAAGLVFRPAPTPDVRPTRNGALLPEVELTEPKPAPIMLEQPGHGEPVAIGEVAETPPAPLPADTEDIAVPAHALFAPRPASYRPGNDAQSAELTVATEPVLYADGAADMSLRNADFPNTYISQIEVDLTSPQHHVRLTWTGPNAARQEMGPFHSSPGAGTGSNDCDDMEECNREGSNCTPKGEFSVEAFSDYMKSHPEARYVTWFLSSRAIALHSYPNVPYYPASHGCVRLHEHAAQLIHNNSLMGKTKVTVGGTWSR